HILIDADGLAIVARAAAFEGVNRRAEPRGLLAAVGERKRDCVGTAIRVREKPLAADGPDDNCAEDTSNDGRAADFGGVREHSATRHQAASGLPRCARRIGHRRLSMRPKDKALWARREARAHLHCSRTPVQCPVSAIGYVELAAEEALRQHSDED